MQIDRLTFLSLVKYLKAEITSSGWSTVTFVDKYPDSEDKIVVSGTGASDEVVIPAVTMVENSAIEGRLAGIGETTREHNNNFTILLYAKTQGQELDLRQFLVNRLYNSQINVYDFSASGFPGTGNEEILSFAYVNRINHSPAYVPHHPNAAVRYGGVINFDTLVYI